MKKIFLLCTSMFAVMYVLSGCSSGGSSSRAVIAPSASVVPFGIESISLPFYSDETLKTNFTYNNQGQLVEGIVSVESGSNEDGSPYRIEKTIYTLDPNRDASAFYPEMARSVGSIASLAKGVVSGHNPLDSLPGSLLKVEYTRTEAEATTPEEHNTTTYSYDIMDRLEQLIVVTEKEGKAPHKNTLSYTYKSTGDLDKVKIVQQEDTGNGWEDTYLSEKIYEYDSGRVIKEETYSLGDNEEWDLVRKVNYDYTFDVKGRIEKIVQNETAGENTYEYTFEYAYGEFGLVTYIYNDSEETTTLGFTYISGSGLLEMLRETTLEKDNGAVNVEEIGFSYDLAGRLTSITSDSDAENRIDYKTTFEYDDKGRLSAWTDEDYIDNDVDEKIVATLEYDASESSAQGPIEFFELDDGGNLSSSTEPREMFFSFAAGAPTATLDVAMETSYVEGFGTFKETLVTIPVPALYGVGYGALYAGLGIW